MAKDVDRPSSIAASTICPLLLLLSLAVKRIKAKRTKGRDRIERQIYSRRKPVPPDESEKHTKSAHKTYESAWTKIFVMREKKGKSKLPVVIYT